MKDLLEIILKGLASYVPVLAAVVATPKRSILKLINNQPGRLNRALTFAGFTLAVGFALQAPLVQSGQDFLTVAGSILALKMLAFLTFSGVILLIFRLFDGKGDYETTLCASLYITSPVYLFLIVTHVLSLGIISSHDSDYALLWRTGQGLSAEQWQAFINLAPVTAGALLLLWLFRFLVSSIWFLICWGAYRSVHQVSAVRSAFAYLMTTIFWYLYWFVTLLLMKGLFAGGMSPLG